ncbi:MAG: SufS family cysteine desulfurase [Anaerolineales bacterium]|nr:SufS family cysteine desulfurase [Anaerolineales bacterium]
MAVKTTTGFDVQQVRKDFPVLSREVRPGVPLIYLDSAATSQKPEAVLQAMSVYYRENNANIHRGIHQLAEEATHAYETAREKIVEFIHAPSAEQLIFTRNTTEAINLVAFSWGRNNLSAGDRILLTEMEHHSNLVPWQLLAAEMDLVLDFIPVTPEGLLDLDQYQKLLKNNPKLLALTHMSNVLGTINPIKEIIRDAKSIGAVTLVDGAQSVPHFPVNVVDLEADFYAFSAHKMCGPTGIGALYGQKDLLEKMPPFLGGGEMIKRVELRSFKANDLPHKFEAGTPAIAEAVGFGAAVDYLLELGMDKIEDHERLLTNHALEKLAEIPDLTVLGPPAEKKGGVISFYIKDIHAHDVAQILDGSGVAIRAGHHCAQPLHTKFNLPATGRASMYLYNTLDEVDKFVAGIQKVKDIFG